MADGDPNALPGGRSLVGGLQTVAFSVAAASLSIHAHVLGVRSVGNSGARGRARGDEGVGTALPLPTVPPGWGRPALISVPPRGRRTGRDGPAWGRGSPGPAETSSRVASR